MISDIILYAVREFRDIQQGSPNVIYLDTSSLIQLKYEIGLRPEDDLDVYGGMRLVVDDSYDTVEVDFENEDIEYYGENA